VGQDHQHGKHDWINARCEHGGVCRNKGSVAQSYCRTIQGSWNARSNGQRISPGLTNSTGVQDLLHMMVEAHGWPSEPAHLEQKAVSAWAPHPVGRMGRVDEVANLVAFVASPLTDYMNGSNLRIDGGLDPTIC
jgi:NAD(P)-dependent dehydrogenase (short-subunit alcohol dehydrogenase family)